MSGLSWFGVLVIDNLPPSFTSHAQPDPKRDPAAAANCSLSLAKLPNAEVIALPTAPLGSPPLPGPMICQNIEWFQWPPPLLRTAVRTDSGTELMPRIKSSRDLPASSGAFSIAAFRLLTYA